MPYYRYTAKPQPDKTIHGEIEAESEADAVNKLSKLGLFPIQIQSAVYSLNNRKFSFLRKVSSREIVIFTGQLGNLLGSGVNLINSLDIIFRQTTNKHFQSILNDIVGKIRDGKSLSESLSFYPGVFSNLYVSLVHSGEAGGNLEKAIKRLAEFLQKQEELKDSIRSAMVYPLFVLTVSILTIVVLLTFVIPRLMVMFEDFGQLLPLPTRIIIGTSQFLRVYWWLLVTALCGIVFFVKRLGTIPRYRFFWDGFKLKMFIFGDLILKSEISRVTHTLSLLLSSGITITSAMEIAISLTDNQILKEQLQKFKDRINSGSSLSACLGESGLFPDTVKNIVAVGEETGTLEKSLMNISLDYEKETDNKTKTLMRLLEPTIILVMGLVVGFIVLSMLLPIFQINLIAR